MPRTLFPGLTDPLPNLSECITMMPFDKALPKIESDQPRTQSNLFTFTLSSSSIDEGKSTQTAVRFPAGGWAGPLGHPDPRPCHSLPLYIFRLTPSPPPRHIP